MNPYEAINLVETDLRTLVRLVFGQGDAWLGASKIDSSKLQERRATERSRRPAAAISEDLLDYTEFTELHNFIVSSTGWPKFAQALGTQKHIDTYLSKVGAFRNPTMHSRSLLPFEEHLVLGISGELRNRIALYRRDLEGEEMYWPTIEQIVDSLGNTGKGPDGTVSTGLQLEVGDVVTFKCRAYDPENRELTWRLHQNARGVDLDTKIGNEVELSWTVTDQDIAGNTPIVPIVKSTGPYHRHQHGWGDDLVMFHYSVNPPRSPSSSSNTQQSPDENPSSP